MLNFALTVLSGYHQPRQAPHCYYRPQICLNRAVKHRKLCCVLLSEKMLKQEGAKLVSVLQASVLHLTLTTIITHGTVLVIFSCKAKAKNNPTSV